MILTRIELRTVRMLAKGWTIREVAQFTERSDKTIEQQMRQARKRNGCRTTVELCVRAYVEPLQLKSRYHETHRTQPQFDLPFDHE